MVKTLSWGLEKWTAKRTKDRPAKTFIGIRNKRRRCTQSGYDWMPSSFSDWRSSWDWVVLRLSRRLATLTFTNQVRSCNNTSASQSLIEAKDHVTGNLLLTLLKPIISSPNSHTQTRIEHPSISQIPRRRRSGTSQFRHWCRHETCFSLECKATICICCS